MSILKKADAFRRKFMRKFSKNIGSSQSNKNVEPIIAEQVKRVLISRPNHRLGNQLLISPLVQEVSEVFPNAKIDLFVKGNVALILFKNYESIDRIIRLPKKHFKQIFKYIGGWLKLRSKNYDIVINVEKGSSSGRLSTKFAKSKYKFFGDVEANLQDTFNDYNHIAKYPVYDFRNFVTQLGVTIDDETIPPLNIKISQEELAEGKKILEGLVEDERKTICLFTFATGAKLFPKSWWEEFHNRLKKEYSGYNFIEILPIENVSQISFKEPSYYSKEIREMCSVMANCELFIGADSGIMHLASASRVPVVGLFSVTKMSKYEPYNGGIGINTKTTDIDGMIKEIDKMLLK